MHVFEEMRRAVEGVERYCLPDVAAAVWKAYGAGGLTDEQAEQLDALLQARQGAVSARAPERASEPSAPACARARKVSRAGSRPRTPDSKARCRRWAAAGYLPPALAASFTAGEQAVLAVIAAEVGKRGVCVLAHAHVAALAGVSDSTARRAVRLARSLGLITVEERRIARRRNETNIVRITSKGWTSWLRLRLPRSTCSLSGGQIQTGTSISKIKAPGSRRSVLRDCGERSERSTPLIPDAA